MLNCVYHPTENMRVVEDSEREALLATGAWFDSLNEAKEMRLNYERRIREDEKSRKRKSKLETKDDGRASQLEQRVCEEPRSDDSNDGVSCA